MNEDGMDGPAENMDEMDVGPGSEDYGDEDGGYDNLDDEDDDFRPRGRGRGFR